MSDLTIRDIARLAGVSTTAVSFVLNDRPGVSDETRRNVQEIIRRTGFTPNVHTRRLNLGRSFTIHVVLAWHKHDLFNQFALEILFGIFQACKTLGYSVIFTFVDSEMDRAKLLRSVRGKDCDGVILSQIDDPLIISSLQQEKIPFICVDAHVKKDGSVPLVEVDYYQAVCKAVEYLHACGHTKIGYLGPTTPLELHATTFAAYTDALRTHGLICDPAWIGNIPFAPDASGAFIQGLLDGGQMPTALLCVGDAFAIDLFGELRSRGIRIPEDLSVISMDDIVVSRYLDPPLTTMTFAKQELGASAVQMLYKMIEGEQVRPVTLVPVQLVERGSVRKL